MWYILFLLLIPKEHALTTILCQFRFEMPYNIWCDGCKNHIGMGKRKKKHLIIDLHTICFHIHNTYELFVQGYVTMLRRRKWGTTTPRQSTGKQRRTRRAVKTMPSSCCVNKKSELLVFWGNLLFFFPKSTVSVFLLYQPGLG